MNINAIGIIFSNMHDEEMHEITNCRTMGALPFGGRYRLIDFALSNMHNSGITSVGVIAKSNYQSLLEHLGSGKEWDLSRKREGLYVFPPFSRMASGIYKNKIEALYGIMTYIKKSKYEYAVITDCDSICNMNWNEPLQYHIQKKADITAVYFEAKTDREIKNQTVYKVSNDGYVSDMLINYSGSGFTSPCTVGTNMWIIRRSFLIQVIEDAIAHNLEDIERDIIQKNLQKYTIAAWKFDGYLRKTNSILDYFMANMDMLDEEKRLDLLTRNGTVYTKVLDAIPSRYGEDAKVSNSLIADGCIIEGSVENSVLFRGAYIGKGASIKNSVIMKDCNVGEQVKLDYILADKEVIFSDNRELKGCELRPIYFAKGSRI